MKTWWTNLSIKEKQTVFFGALICSFLLIYQLVYIPIKENIIHLHHEVLANEKLLAWMKTADMEIKLLQQNGQSLKLSQTHLLSFIENDIKQNTIAKNLIYLKASDNDSIHLKLSQANFDNVIAWIINLNQKRPVQLLQLIVSQNGKPGQVDVESSLKT